MVVNPSTLVALLISASSETRSAFLHHHNTRFHYSPPQPRRGDVTPTFVVQDVALHLRTTLYPTRDDGDGVVVGRDTDERAVDILIADVSGSSRKHLTFKYEWDCLAVSVTNVSEQGTFVTSFRSGLTQRLGPGQKHILEKNDWIALGTATMQIRYVDHGLAEEIFKTHWHALATSCGVTVPSIFNMSLHDRGQDRGFNAIPITEKGEAEIRLIRRIGSGSYGDVYHGQDVWDNDYAVRVFDEKDADLVERTVLSALKHENIVRYRMGMNIAQHRRVGPNDSYLVMDYAACGTLEDYKMLTVPQATSACWQILSALHFGHELGICHQDIKPNNILVTSLDPFTIAVADYGLSTYGPEGTRGGHIQFAAPELPVGHWGEYDGRVDVWSLGILLLRMSTLIGQHQPDGWKIGNQVGLLLAARLKSHRGWEIYTSHLQNAKARPGWEFLTELAKTMVTWNRYQRPTAKDCMAVLERKCTRDIEPWILKPRATGRSTRQQQPIKVCLTSLLDYVNANVENRNATLARLAKRRCNNEIFLPHAGTREPGLYVPLDVAALELHKYNRNVADVVEQYRKTHEGTVTRDGRNAAGDKRNPPGRKNPRRDVFT